MKLNWAERWAVNNPIRPLQQHLEISWLKKRVMLEQGARVLEVGCGRGAGSGLIKTLFNPAALHAMDLDTRMIHKALKYLSPGEREGISFFVGDAIRLPHRDDSMDAVFGFGVLHHIPDWQLALSEIVRVLKKGGIYFFEELYPSLYQNLITRHILLHPRENRFHSRDLKQAMNRAGLELGDCLEHEKLEIIGFAFKR
ncbi:MAG TPA: class I SAM-dependent methyltransferase [Desulfomonilia bacterium]|nr:class I SAM-dependent methyltransferase [Desulfomonilia bacterium]